MSFALIDAKKADIPCRRLAPVFGRQRERLLRLEKPQCKFPAAPGYGSSRAHPQ
jgi:hypothetical protein